MTENSGEARSARTAAGVVLGGLAVGAILGAATPAQADAGAPAAAETRAACVRDQVRDAFTAGALTPTQVPPPAIICDTA